MQLLLKIFCLVALAVSIGCNKDKPVEPVPPDPFDVIIFDWIDGSPSWSPDGKEIAYTHYDSASGANQLWVVDVNTLEKRYMQQYSGVPDWSPDNNWLVFGRGDALGTNVYKIKPSGDSLTMITNTGISYYPKWLPDGITISYFQPGTENGIYFINTDGTEPRLKISGPKGVYRDWSVSYKLAYNEAENELHVSDSLGLQDTKLYGDEYTFINSIDWSPDEGKILFSARNRRIGLTQYEVLIINSDGTGLTRLTYDGGDCPALSPDGTKIVYTRHDQNINPFIDSTNGRLWVMDSDGSNRYQITFP